MAKIGDPVWVFDENRRAYRREDGVGMGPIWREHWSKRWIVGENRVSWILGHDPTAKPFKHSPKVPKVRRAPFSIKDPVFEEKELDEREWVHRNRYAISHAVASLDEFTLRRVAQLIGYQDKAGSR